MEDKRHHRWVVMILILVAAFLLSMPAFAQGSNIRYADQYAGADAGAKIAACMADLPGRGGICDARQLQPDSMGDWRAASTINIARVNSATLLLGHMTLQSSADPIFNIATGVEIIGTGIGSTIIQQTARTNTAIDVDAQGPLIARDFSIRSTSTQTLGYAIRFTDSIGHGNADTHISNVEFVHQWIDIFSGVATGFRIDHTVHAGIQSIGIQTKDTINADATDGFIGPDNIFNCDPVARPMGTAIEMVSGGLGMIANNKFFTCTYAWHVAWNPPAAPKDSTGQLMFIGNRTEPQKICAVQFDRVADHGSIANIIVSDNWGHSDSTNNNGFLCVPSNRFSWVSQIQAVGNHIYVDKGSTGTVFSFGAAGGGSTAGDLSYIVGNEIICNGTGKGISLGSGNAHTQMWIDPNTIVNCLTPYPTTGTGLGGNTFWDRLTLGGAAAVNLDRYKLDIQDSLNATSRIFGNYASGPQLLFQNSSSPAGNWAIGGSGYTNAKDFVIHDNSSGGAGTVMTFQQGTGRVGIGQNPATPATIPSLLSVGPSSQYQINGSGQAVHYNNTATIVGGGFGGQPYTVGQAATTASSASVGKANILAATDSSTAQYTVAYYLYQSAAGTGCAANAAVTVTIGWTDPGGAGTAQSVTSTSVAMGNAVAAGNFARDVIPIVAKASTAITYSTTWANGTGCSTQPTYSLQAWVTHQ